MRRHLILLGVSSLLLLAGASAAQGARTLPPDVRAVYQDYARGGQISPCRHTVSALQRTLGLIPRDIAQYAPDFPGLVRAALEAHARGECGGRRQAVVIPRSSATVPPAATPVQTAVPTKTVAADPPRPEPTVGAVAGPAKPPVADVAIRSAAAARPANPAPAPVWIIGIVACLLALLGLAILAARRTAAGEERLARIRHSWGEATWRASGTWAEFLDWVRIGR